MAMGSRQEIPGSALSVGMGRSTGRAASQTSSGFKPPDGDRETAPDRSRANWAASQRVIFCLRSEERARLFRSSWCDRNRPRRSRRYFPRNTQIHVISWILDAYSTPARSRTSHMMRYFVRLSGTPANSKRTTMPAIPERISIRSFAEAPQEERRIKIIRCLTRSRAFASPQRRSSTYDRTERVCRPE